MPEPLTRTACEARDAADALAPLREQFDLPAGLIYLDGNSLGPLPRATAERIRRVVTGEWGNGLIRSWNSAGWIDLPHRVGDKIATLIGARDNEVVAVDSTSLNLYKVLSVALSLTATDAPRRKVILSERDNFPTDLYIAESLARQHGFTLRLADGDDILSQCDDDVAVLLLTQVNYRTGRMHDMTVVTTAAHQCGTLVVWDLSHSAGAVPIDLTASDADFAIGCGYKYLNGGPGSPAFVWAHPRHLARMDAERRWQPLSGWLGHAAPFDFATSYRPAHGIARFVSGTPSPITLAALECGIDTVLAAGPLGGMTALRTKSLELTALFITLIEQRCASQGFDLQTPRQPDRRGSQVSLLRHEGAYAIVQALIARGVIGDYRDPAILRFGFTPLYLRFVDVWDAVDHLSLVLERDEWREPRFNRRAAVT
ncbi:MAG TPA: kynureninase [Vicinamibacterales bacterium]